MGRTKHTYEQVRAAFDERGYELLTTEYCGVTQKLEYVCRKHKDKGVLTIDFKHLTERGQGCKYCAKERYNPRRTPDSVIVDMCQKNDFTFIESKSENGKIIVYYICNKHKDKRIQRTPLMSLKNKKRIGCRYCIGIGKKTHEEFLSELHEINPNIIILSQYVSADDPIDCRCMVCSHEWTTTPNRLLSAKTGCRKCGHRSLSNHKTKPNEQFVQELKDNKPYIIALEEYNGAKTKMQFKCLKCGTIFYSTPDGVLQSKFGCQKCAQDNVTKNQTKSHHQFVDELYMANPQLIPLEQYKTDHEKIIMYCTIHDYIWMVAPNKVLHKYTGCPKCSLYHNEKRICNILDNWGYEYDVQKTYDDCKDKHPLPFDIYLTNENVLIEYDGEGHYMSITRSHNQTEEDALKQLHYTQFHDEIKTKYCKKNNIPLIRIPYWEQDNLEEYLFDELCKYNLIEEIV